jgi:hypothetical protein
MAISNKFDILILLLFFIHFEIFVHLAFKYLKYTLLNVFVVNVLFIQKLLNIFLTDINMLMLGSLPPLCLLFLYVHQFTLW